MKIPPPFNFWQSPLVSWNSVFQEEIFWSIVCVWFLRPGLLHQIPCWDSPCALGCDPKVMAKAVVEIGLLGLIFVSAVSWERWMEISSEPTTVQNKSWGAAMLLWERNQKLAVAQVHAPQNTVFARRKETACLGGPIAPSFQLPQSHQVLILGKRGHAHHVPTAWHTIKILVAMETSV